MSGVSKSVPESIGHTMSSYTYTGISVGFSNREAELFKAYDVQDAGHSRGGAHSPALLAALARHHHRQRVHPRHRLPFR